MKTTLIMVVCILTSWFLASNFPISISITPPEIHPSDPDAIADKTLGQLEQEILGEINLLRIAEGRNSLRWDKSLGEKAQQHSETMVTENTLFHSTFNVYENVVWLPASSAGKNICKNILRTWLSSPGHRDNLLRRDILTCGIGVAKSKNGGTFVTYMAE